MKLEDIVKQRYDKSIPGILTIRKNNDELLKNVLNTETQKVKSKIGKKQAITLIGNLKKPFNNRNEIVTIDATNKEASFKATIYEKAINNLWRENKFSKSNIKNIAINMTFRGNAFIEVGWEFSTRKIKILEKEFKEDANYEDEYKDFEIENQDDKTIVYKEVVNKNEPFIKVYDINDVVFDTNAKDDEPLDWFIIEKVVSYEKLLLDGYENEFARKAYNRAKSLKALDSMDTIDDDKKKEFRLIKYYGYETSGLFTFPILAYFVYDGSEMKLIEKTVEPFPFDDIPIVNIKLYDIDNTVVGKSLQWAINEEDKFNNSIKRAIIDNLANSNYNKVFYKKGSLSKAGKEALQSNKPYIEVNTTSSIRDVIEQGNFNPLPQSIFSLLNMTNYEASQITGISEAMQGAGSNDLKAPASNFAQMTQWANTRLEDFIGNITDGLKQVFSLWIDFMSEYYELEELGAICNIDIGELKRAKLNELAQELGLDQLGDEDKLLAKQFLAKEIEDKFNFKDNAFDFKFKVSSDGLKQLRINSNLMLTQQLAPLAQAGAVDITIIKEIIASIAEDMDRYEVADKIRSYNPQPSEQEQMMAQMELQAKQAEVAEKTGKAQKENALAQNANARTKLTEAKANEAYGKIEPEISKAYMEIAKQAKELEDDKTGTDKQTDNNG
jgi:hypothetical protein